MTFANAGLGNPSVSLCDEQIAENGVPLVARSRERGIAGVNLRRFRDRQCPLPQYDNCCRRSREQSYRSRSPSAHPRVTAEDEPGEEQASSQECPELPPVAGAPSEAGTAVPSPARVAPGRRR